MEVRTKLVKTNEEFINALEDVSRISGKITEIETFTSENALKQGYRINTISRSTERCREENSITDR